MGGAVFAVAVKNKFLTAGAGQFGEGASRGDGQAASGPDFQARAAATQFSGSAV